MKAAFPLTVIFFLVFCGFKAVAQQHHVATRIQGYVFTIDDEGSRIDYPFPIQTIRQLLAAEYWRPAQPAVTEPLTPDIDIHKVDELDTAIYSIQVPIDYVGVRVVFEYPRFFGVAERDLQFHTATRPMHLYIRELYSSTSESYNHIKDIINKSSPTYDELNSAIDDLDDLFSNSPKTRYLLDLSLLSAAILQSQSRIEPMQARKIQNITYADGFELLPHEDRFKIYRELGWSIVRHSTLIETIESSYTHADMALEFYAKAIDIHEENASKIEPGLIALVYQEKYKIECEVDSHHACFDTISEFASKFDNMNGRTYRAFFSDFAYELSILSDYGNGRDPTNAHFVERISETTFTRDMWVKFHCSANSHDVIMAHLLTSHHLEQMTTLASRIFARSGKSCEDIQVASNTGDR